MKKYTCSKHAARAGLLAFVMAILLPAAHAGGEHKHEKTVAVAAVEDTAFGKVGDPKKIDRTIEVTMGDKMRFSPATLTVRQGETIRFLVRNGGRILHEMVIGTVADFKLHAEMMKQHPAMAHDEAYMSHVDPGKKGEMTWQFTRPGVFHFACLVPGHFEAGMVGKIVVTKG